MFGIKAFGETPFSDAGSRDIRLYARASSADSLTAAIATQVRLSASASASDAVIISAPVVEGRLYSRGVAQDTLSVTFMQCLMSDASASDIFSAPLVTGILLSSSALITDTMTAEQPFTQVLLVSEFSAIDSLLVELNMSSHAIAEDVLSAEPLTEIRLATHAFCTDEVSIPLNTYSLLVTNASCGDSLTLLRVDGGTAVYPSLNRYVCHAAVRDYQVWLAERDYIVVSKIRGYVNISLTRDYNVYHDSEGSAMTIKILSTKDPAETVPVKFFFDNMVNFIDTVDDVEISLFSGEVDAGMSTMLVGEPIISDSLVIQMVAGGIAGNEYKLRCTIHSGSEIYVSASILPIEVE